MDTNVKTSENRDKAENIKLIFSSFDKLLYKISDDKLMDMEKFILKNDFPYTFNFHFKNNRNFNYYVTFRYNGLKDEGLLDVTFNEKHYNNLLSNLNLLDCFLYRIKCYVPKQKKE